MTRTAPALPSLLRRAALLLALAVASVPALAAPPTDGDINRLLSASRAQSMIDTMLPQIEAMQQQQFQQVAAQRQLNAQQQEQLKRIQARTSQTLRQALSWQQLRPMYVDLYKKTFSKEDVLAMAEFYESAAGTTVYRFTCQPNRSSAFWNPASSGARTSTTPPSGCGKRRRSACSSMRCTPCMRKMRLWRPSPWLVSPIM